MSTQTPASMIQQKLDTYPALLETLKAIGARIEGNYDHPALVAKGELGTYMLDDIHKWARSAIAEAEGVA